MLTAHAAPRTLSSLLCALWLGCVSPVAAETGYELWLRYVPVEDAALLDTYRQQIGAVLVQGQGDSPTLLIASRELERGLGGLLGTPVPVRESLDDPPSLVVGTPTHSPLVAGLGWGDQLAELGAEGFLIRTAKLQGRPAIVIASEGEVGTLYGSFHLLHLLQTGRSIEGLDVSQRPRLQRRLLNHWDNLDGSVERGYAGESLWRWDQPLEDVQPRLEDYARANASLGINGTVLNNVNADPDALGADHLQKVAAVAKVLRPYGIRVYLSANFATPMVRGGLPTADPLDSAVARWWREKVAQIYDLIPDFGGFLVKANSEGQPGPQDFGRSHQDGANLLGEALRPHGGVVMWRAFVYDADVDPDRVKRAYLDFVPLDGGFVDNVFVQVKNGPLDFQPREPFHPLFGAMPKTPLMAELQVTQEYLGHSTHLVYLAPMWKEFLDADSHAHGPGSTVARIVDGSLEGHRHTGIAGVANTGRDLNWTGHHFGQANWYAYGRLAWDPDLGAEQIAEDWIRMTWGHGAQLVATIREMMMGSREALVRYSMPLGLHHLIGGDHFAPMPENPDPRRADWSAIYYHQADASGIGFDRTRSGSDAVAQYHSPLRERWGDPRTCPEELLLWFHRLPWDHRLSSGRSVWEELVFLYSQGAREALELEEAWRSLEGRVDPERHRAVAEKLRQQAADAVSWRDKCLGYFQAFSRGPLTTH